MKFTSEDLMKAIGLNVGDRIKLNGRYYTIEINELSKLPVYANDKKYITITSLIDKEFEILPRHKRVGELMCDEEEIDCLRCPLKSICRFIAPYDDGDDMSLYKALELHIKRYNIDQEIYDLLKARLDKVVE